MMVLALTVTLAVMGRIFEVIGPRGTSHPGIDAGHPGSPNQAETILDEYTQAEDRSAHQLPNQQDMDSDHERTVQVEGRSPDRAGGQVPANARTENRATVGDSDIAPEVRSVDHSVVGQPFAVSESILLACKKSPRRGGCEPGIPLLEKMAKEPREEPWASSAEQAIRALVELEPGTDRPRPMTYTIRNLECRKSICFVETASIMEGFHTNRFYFERENRLRAGYSMFSSETKEDGNKVYVTLLPVVRVPFSTRELTEQGRRQ